MNRRPGRLHQILALVLFGFLYAPILAVVAMSFSRARHGMAWEGFSLEWYQALPSNAAAISALQNSLVLAVVSTAISTLIGTLLGCGLARRRFAGRRWIELGVQVPVLLPDIVMAVSMLLFSHWARRHLGLMELGMPTMILAHVTFQIPFVALVVSARHRAFDPAWFEAARDLGADRWLCFRFVTLPLLLPGIFAGALLAFALSLDDFVVSFFTSGPGSMTLPILIHSSARRGLTPEIHALSALLIVAAVGVTLLASRFQKPSDMGRG